MKKIHPAVGREIPFLTPLLPEERGDLVTILLPVLNASGVFPVR